MLRGLMQERPLLISSLIEYAARNHGDTPIVSRLPDGSLHRYGYRGLHERAKRLANALLALGVKPGDRVATLAWNTHRHMELYYAVSGIGAVLHTVNPRLFPDQLEYICNHAEDRFLFFDLTFAPLLHKLRARFRTIEGYIGLGDEAQVQKAGDCGGPVLAYETLLAAQSPAFDWPIFDENTASSLCYTSGTTGNPKGVLYSHRSTVLHSFAVCAADGLGLSSRDCALVIVPLFHANAWGVPYAAAMCGAKLVLPGPMLDGASVCQLLTDEKVNFSMGVPTVWMNFFAHLDKHPGARPPYLTRVVIGGSAVPAAMLERFEKGLGISVLHLWGMTETSPLGTTSVPPFALASRSPDELHSLKIKQGRAIYGVDMKIVDDENAELPHDGKAFGLLKVRGPWITRQYFKGEGGNILDDGDYFSTGDVATLDEFSYMQITDRAKDVIKSGGEWISSIELENAAVAFPGVHEAAVIGLPHPTWQERPLLIVVQKPGASVDKDALRAHLAQHVARWWLPDDITFVQELPHTATGKLSKLTLRQQFKDYVLPSAPSREGGAA